MQVFKVHVLSTQRTNAFVVDIQDVNEGKFTWQIEKMYDAFKHLKSAMKDKFTDGNPTWKSMALFPTPESLGNFLTSALSFLGDSVWSYDPMLNFLDNASQKSYISELKLIKLSSQVASLEKKSSDLEKSQELLLENFKAFQAKIDHYLRTGSDTVSGTVVVPRLSWDSKVSDINANKISNPHLSITSMATTESGDESAQHVSQSGDEPSDIGDDDTSSLRTPVSSSEFAPTRNSIALMTVNTGSSNRDSSMPNSIYLPSELFPLLVSNGANHPFDIVVNSTLQKIAPVELQIQHRQSVILLLKKLIRIALGSTAFEYGVQMTRCLLPDDPIKISVMLSKSLLPTWHTVLCEYLTAYAERANIYGGSSFVPPDEDEQNLDPYFHDLAPPANHFLGNVSHVKQNLMHSVTLIVDSIVVDITPNNRAELCLTSFVEDVSQAIGSHDLFKRSLLLVRAWWALEAQTYVGCSIRHYLTDFQLFVMLAGVFNQYATFIKSPTIAFCFFLAEYSGYDGISKAISIRGFAPFQTKTSNQPNLPDAKPHFVISESLLEKYWVLFNISHAQEQQDQQQRKRSHSSSDDEPSVSDGNIGNQNMNSPSHNGQTGDGTAENITLHGIDEYVSSLDKLLVIDAVRDSMKALSTNNLFLFDRSSYNIIHPLCHMNMITEKLSQRRVSRLAKAFQSSAVAVAAILRNSSNNNAGATGTPEQFDSMCACFSNIRAFNNLWNQTQLPVDLLSIVKDPFEMSKMLQCIQYSNLIIESAVNDEGLLILTQEILAVKGPLPVGEIGKVLAETTSIPNLSVKLKEKYGGLKRYLEAYQDRFVISNDHPFNPNVLLRCSLAPEHLEMIDKGNFPLHIVARAKKASAAAAARRKKTAPSLCASVTNVDPNSFTVTSTATNNNNNNVNNATGHTASPMISNLLPLSPLMTPGVGSSSVSASSGNTTSVNAYNRPLSNPSQSQQQVSPNIANLSPQQQNLVHTTVQQLKNMSQPSPAPVASSSVSNNNNSGTPGMSLSVAQLTQQYGGNNSTNMNSKNNNNRPKTFPAGGSVNNNLPSGAVKLPMPGLNNNNNVYINNNNNTNSGYFGVNNGNNNNNNSTMRLGSNPYSASSVPMQQTRTLNNNNSIDISAFANAAAAHWSQHQQQQQQPSRRSSHNSEFNDNCLSNSLSTPVGGNSGNNSNNNSNHNSLNSSNNGSGLLTGGSRDNVRVLFGNSLVSNANNNANNNATSATNSFGKLTSLFEQSGSPQVGFGSFLSNASNSTNTSANNSRPTSLGQTLTASDPSGNNNMNGFGAFGVMDVSKLGLDLDVLSLTAPNAMLSSLASSSSILNNNNSNYNNSNNNNGTNSNNYNLW